MKEVLANLRTSIEESGAGVECARLPVVRADGSHLGQVFTNLISNAIKFRGVQPPRIRVEARRKGPNWILSVADNGIGIAPAYFGKIFEIFERLHSRQQYAGTGVGLAICKKIVEGYNGRIWVESQPGEGTTFFFTVPAVD
jgi:light-regulated signal transduction histidine kinase (bacteriophytochrome)